MIATEPKKPGRKFALQWRPNLIQPERRLVLTRIYWNRGMPGDGKGYSAKLSISLCVSSRLVIGVLVKPELWGFILYIAPLPCLALRIHHKRAYGGWLF